MHVTLTVIHTLTTRYLLNGDTPKDPTNERTNKRTARKHVRTHGPEHANKRQTTHASKGHEPQLHRRKDPKSWTKDPKSARQNARRGAPRTAVACAAASGTAVACAAAPRTTVPPTWCTATATATASATAASAASTATATSEGRSAAACRRSRNSNRHDVRHPRQGTEETDNADRDGHP